MLHQSAELLELTLNTNVIQVTNVAPAATLDQMQTLFSFLGEVDEIKMYPAEDCPLQPSSRICYVRYADKTSVGVAQHLTNTVFIDRALIVVPVADGIIPDETKAMAIASPSPNVSGLVNSGQSQLMNQVVSGVGGSQVITTIDPHLTALGLPQYPPLPANMDPTKIEEIRRTVYVGNLDSTITAEGLLKFFNQIGEVKYVRMAGDETQPTRFAFVEFTEQTSVANALQYNGVIFGGRPLKINHSNNAIVKPQAKSSEAAQREIEEAMKRVREAQSLITAAIEPVLISELAEKEKKKDKSRSRSRSRSRIRSLSRSRRRSRSRSHHRSRSGRRSRSRSHHRSPLHRSRSHTRRHSRSPGHHSRSKVRKSRSRSRDRHSKRSRSPHTRHHRSRSKSKERASKKHTRSRSHSKSPSKKKSSKSSKSDSKKEKDKSPKEDKKKESKETTKKEEPVNEEIKQNNLTTELEVAKIIAGILEEETKKQSENKNVKTEKSEVSEILEPIKKEEEEKGKKRQRSRTPSKYSASPTKSPKYRSSRSPSRHKSARSPTRHKTSHSPSRHKSSHSPSHQKLSRSPSHRKSSRSPSRHKTSHSPSRKKSSRSPSRQKSSRSPGRHHHSHSPSYSQKRKSRSPKRSYSKRSPVSRQKSRSPSYRSSRSPNQKHHRSSHSPKRWSRSPRRRSRSRSHSIRRESKHKKKREEGLSEEKDKENKKKKKEETSHKESKVVRDYDEEEKGFDSTPEEIVQRPPEPPGLPENEKQQDSLSPIKVETKNSDSEGTDHKPGDMDLDSD